MYKEDKMMYKNIGITLTKRVRIPGKLGNRGKREKTPNSGSVGVWQAQALCYPKTQDKKKHRFLDFHYSGLIKKVIYGVGYIYK